MIEKENNTCPHGYPAEARAECPDCKRLIEIYSDPNYESLYRYENQSVPYDETREVSVSKERLVGTWFTNKIDDFSTYVKARQPGGNIIVVRIPKADLGKYDASTNAETQDMDIERGNYIISPDEQRTTRLQIPLAIDTSNSKKFLLKDWGKINEFIGKELAPEKIVRRIKGE